MATSRINGILSNKDRVDALRRGMTHDTNSPCHSESEVLHELSSFDPTKNRQYLNWLVDRYGEQNFRLEDKARIIGALGVYHEVKPVLEKSKRDIGRFSSVAEVEDVISGFIKDDDSFISNKEMIRQAKAGAEKLYDLPHFKVIIPKTHEASMYYGYGTRWCTTSKTEPEVFENYASQGPLYIIIAGDRKFQLHYESDQFMNERDESVTEDDIAFLSSIPEYKDFLESLIVRRYSLPEDKL